MASSFPDDAELPSPARAEMSARIAQRLKRNPMVSAIPNERVEIYLRHGFFSPTECAELLRRIDADNVPSKLFSGAHIDGYRTSTSCNLDVTDPLIIKLTQRMDALTGIPTENGEALQGQRYAPGQEYKVHCDFFPALARYWPQMRDAGGQRCWTAMLYLNTVEEGGETHFVRAGFMVPPRAGTLLVWNNLKPDGSPNVDTLHAALPVKRGVKYVLTKWYREREWEPVRIAEAMRAPPDA